jgi:hypothetical protein
MTPEALPTQPRKASWKRWMTALASVLAIIAAALLLKAATPEPVSIWLVCSTNVNGVKTLVFQGTNGTAGKIAYSAWFTTNLTASYLVNAFPAGYEDAARGSILPGKSFTFSLVAPPKEPARRFMWDCSGPELDPKRWVRLRAECADFLMTHGMWTLAARIAPWSRRHYILASEIKE